jgi:GDP-L-fucose synthase
MSIGIVGATGLVGRHVVEALAIGDVQIRATYNRREPYDAHRTEWVQCDLRQASDALKALQGVDTAVICAGQLSTSAVLSRDPTSSILDSLRIVTNVLEAAAHLRLRRIVLMSSCTAYPDLGRPAVEADIALGEPPAQWFGVGSMHRYLEQQLRWYVEFLGLIGSACVLRPTLVYGPYDDFNPATGHFVPAMIRKIVERVKPIDIWGDGKQTRNLLHAGDLAGVIVAMLDRGERPFEVYNVASLLDASINDVVNHLIELDEFSDAVVVHELERGGGPSSLSVSTDALVRAMEWKPKFDLRSGLADALNWYRRTRLTHK